ncbi:MAG: hypothetical protein HY758_10825 [Nitrospirae bacterium]|nr:hypothetical protein [Nitrospirota bacterium]
MVELNTKMDMCHICKHEYTSTYVEAMDGIRVFVCENCLEAAKHNFIWVCMGCGKVYVRPKALVIDSIKDFELKRAYLLCQDMQIIQGIDMCIKCDPEGIINYVKNVKVGMEC